MQRDEMDGRGEDGAGKMGTRRGRTHKLDTPAEEGRLEVLVIAKFPALEDLHGVDDRDTAVELSAWDVVLEILCSTRRTCQSKMSARGAREGLKENARAGTIQLHPLAYPAA